MITVPACIQQHLLLSVFFWIQYVVAAKSQGATRSLKFLAKQLITRAILPLLPTYTFFATTTTTDQNKNPNKRWWDGKGRKKKASIQNQKLLKLRESLKSNNPRHPRHKRCAREREETPTTHGKTSWYSWCFQGLILFFYEDCQQELYLKLVFLLRDRQQNCCDEKSGRPTTALAQEDPEEESRNSEP